MRSLSFEPNEEGRIRWDVCYGGLVVNPEGYTGHARRVVRRILGKLEDIGKPTEDQSGLVKFELTDDGGTIDLEEAEYKILLEVVDEKVRWTRDSIKKADDTVLWLEGIKEPIRKKAENAAGAS